MYTQTISFKKNIRKLYRQFNFIKENAKYLRLCRFTQVKDVNTFYFVIDPQLKHPGLADILKAIVSCYYIAKANQYKFKLIFKSPFRLEDYFTENKTRWIADFEDLEYSIQSTKFYNFTGNKIPILEKGKQYHCYNYVGVDIFWHEKDHIKMWYNLFTELFKPTNLLIEGIKGTGFFNKDYVTIHLRFVNLLDSFEKGTKTHLTQEQKDTLISKCKNEIKQICNMHANLPIIILSDSKTFLNKLNDMPVIILDLSSLSHISYASSNDSILKTFIDFTLMIKAKYTYKIRGCGLYDTAFSSYAAYAGGKDIIEKDLI